MEINFKMNNINTIINIINSILHVLNEYPFLPGAIGGLVTGCGSWLFIKHRIKTQSTANITEEQLKKELERNNQLLYTTLNHYSGLRKEIHSKRINALDIIWQAFINLKPTIPSSLYLCLAVLENEEFTYNKIFKIIENQIGKPDFNLEHSNQIYKISQPIELSRYLINPDLYNIWRSYLAVTGRVVLIFSEGLKSKNITPWQDDEGILKQFGMWLNESELNNVYGGIGGFHRALELLKMKALNMIMHEATGTEETNNMLKQIEIYEQQDQLFGKNAKDADILNNINS